ncbi:MAG: tetratricopeptide repeat protein [Planctomycetota bacterium]|nr:MAG: tetratricopeptide repeat protein [Planctomycetota bacterium]
MMNIDEQSVAIRTRPCGTRCLPALWASVAAFFAGCADEAKPPAPPQPQHNVILISIDTTRADHLSCYGYPAKTSPYIDAVAAAGVRFERAQTTNPITLPAHSSMLTGTLPPTHGVRDNYNYKLDDSQVTLAEMLSDNGYQTAAFVGAFPLNSLFGLDQGFDVYDDEIPKQGLYELAERRAEEVTDAAVAWLDERDRQPFFMFVHYFDPHSLYRAPLRFATQHIDVPYDAEIAYVDDSLGVLLAKLKELDLYDSSTIIITSDHGEGLEEHGESTHTFFIYQSTAHVPLVIKSPMATAGTVVETPVSIIDIVPTLLELLDIEPPAHLQGIDLGPALRGEPLADADRPTYTESLVPTMFGCAPLRGIVSGSWRYILSPRAELYDLRADPSELNNLIEAEPETAEQLRQRLLDLTSAATQAAAEVATQSLADEERAKLQSLGYLGGEVRDEVELREDMSDAKDFIDAYQRLMKADGMFAAGQREQAKAVCRELLAEQPGIFKAHMLIAKIAHTSKQRDEAIDSYTQALAILDADRRDAGGVSSVTASEAALAFRSLGALLRERNGAGDLERARDVFERGLADFPNDARFSRGLGAVLIDLAARPQAGLKRSELVNRAIELLEEVLVEQPDDADATNNLGVAHTLLGNYERAAEYFEATLELKPDHPNARRNLDAVREAAAAGGS